MHLHEWYLFTISGHGASCMKCLMVDGESKKFPGGMEVRFKLGKRSLKPYTLHHIPHILDPIP